MREILRSQVIFLMQAKSLKVIPSIYLGHEQSLRYCCGVDPSQNWKTLLPSVQGTHTLVHAATAAVTLPVAACTIG